MIYNYNCISLIIRHVSCSVRRALLEVFITLLLYNSKVINTSNSTRRTLHANEQYITITNTNNCKENKRRMRYKK